MTRDRPARGLGYRKDARDPRDRLFAAHRASSGPVPDHASVDVPGVAPKDQRSTSSCVGNAWAQAVRLAYLAAGKPCPELSALDVYRLARNLDGTAGDDGTYLRSGGAAVRKLGVSTEAAWPFDEARVNAQPPFSARHSAFDLSGARGYYRLAEGDVGAVQRALAGGLPVVAGWQVSEVFRSSDGRSLVDVQQAPIAGGHALCVVGYDTAAANISPSFTLCNSWGAGWGFNGRFHATADFVTSASDVWAVDVRGAA
jgi:C1A family cysteine protease